MAGYRKSPRISEHRHGAILDRCRGGLGLRVRRLPEDRGNIEAHHLRPVFNDQRRRSNPLVVDVYTSEHRFLHNNPEYESKIEERLYLRALQHLAGGDIEVIRAAMRGAIEYIAQQEADTD